MPEARAILERDGWMEDGWMDGRMPPVSTTDEIFRSGAAEMWQIFLRGSCVYRLTGAVDPILSFVSAFPLVSISPAYAE